MSDRPCNLWQWKQYQRKYGDRVTLERPGRFGDGTAQGFPDATPADVLLDGKVIASFLSLPDEAHCGAYGGECKC